MHLTSITIHDVSPFFDLCIASEALHLCILAQYIFASIVRGKLNVDVLKGEVRTRCLFGTKQRHGEADVLPRIIRHRCESISTNILKM